jgi:glucokinase
MALTPVLAIDIGGTKLAVALVGPHGSLLATARRATPVSTDAEEVWSALAGLIGELAVEPVVAVGIGSGGPMRDELVSPLNIPAWRDFPLAERIRALLSGIPVVLRNDAIAMAVGEHAYGAGHGARAFLGIVVSTGVGGGIVVNGEPVPGPTGNAGHIGHVVVDADGPPCACGGRGCLEAIARGPAVVAWAQDQGWSGGADGVALVAAARQGDAVPLAALTRAGRALGLACASVAAVLDLDLIAVGGGLSAAGDLLLAPAVAAFERHARLEFAARCRLVPASLGGDAGLVGAGVLALRAADRVVLRAEHDGSD